MAEHSGATPPSGRWRGLVVNGTQSLRIDLQLTFAGENVTGTFSLHESRRRVVTGEFTGTQKGSQLTLYYPANNGSFTGQIQPTRKNVWILSGLLTVPDNESPTASLTAFHTGEEFQQPGGSVWDGETFA